MCNRLDREALGLMALGYVPVRYCEVHCPSCGHFRLGLALDAEPFCPNCPGYKWRCYQMATGFTKRSLPIVEAYLAPQPRDGRGRFPAMCFVPLSGRAVAPCKGLQGSRNAKDRRGQHGPMTNKPALLLNKSGLFST